ncbi:MAG: T9SS type A sorting domain-containing protein [Bacteroidetes bacterium]|nr:T9SS type A sorting domain-containing protein [Bacteroidota bacterium]
MKKQILLLGLATLLSVVMYQYTNAQNLIASYPLNGNANDISGNSLNGTIIGSPGFVADRFGNANSAILFTGNTSERIEINDNALLHTPSISIAAWVKEIGITTILKTIIDKPLGTGIADSWHFGVNTNGGYFYSSWIMNDPGFTSYSQITAPLNVGDWHYVVTTFDNVSKLHKLYVDGFLRASNTFNSTIGYDNSKMYIGAALENNALNFPMDGELDDIKIYDGALTAQQISNEYATGTSYNNAGSGSALYFEGTANQYYAQLPSLLDGTNIFSVDFWVKTTDNNSNPTYWLKPTLVGNANPAAPDGDFGITLNNGQIGVWSGISSSGDQDLQTTKAINDDKWHHVAAVSDGTNLVLYVDGMLLPGSISTAGGTLKTAAWPWFIGKSNSCCSNGSPVNATIDEFRVWNVALTQTQIRDRMCKKITNSDGLYNNLLAYYPFNETIGTGLVDSKNFYNGFLNAGARVISGAPVGDASANDYVNTIKTVSISHASGENFTVTSSSGNPDGIQVYRVDMQPNTLNGTTVLGSMNKYFGVFQAGGTAPQYNAVYNYTGNTDVTAGNENSLALYKRADNSITSWLNSAATQDMSANTLSVSGQSTEYILGIANILPLHLLYFTATKQEQKALLQWQTTNEINCSHFEIQRSSNRIDFTKIGSTPAANSSGTHSYSFTDNLPVSGINYYRLVQVDLDGRFTYSPIVKLEFETNSQGIHVYPNPAANKISIAYTGHQKNVTLSIFDANGKQVMLKTFSNQGLLQTDVSMLTNGVYIVLLNDEAQQTQTKFIKLQ